MGDDNEVIGLDEIIRREGVMHERRGISQPLSKSTICEEEERAAKKPDKGPQRQEESWREILEEDFLKEGVVSIAPCFWDVM